jgi:hypothetical protein
MMFIQPLLDVQGYIIAKAIHPKYPFAAQLHMPAPNSNKRF